LTALRLSRSADAIRPGVFAELQARIERFTAGGGDLVPLQIGDTYLDPPDEARFPAVIDAARLEPELYRYGATLGLSALRAAFAKRLADRWELMADPDRELLLGAGATHALFCSARAVLDPGDDVLLASPYWPLAHGVLTACGARVIEVPFSSRLYDDPTLDAGEIFRAALTPKTKAIYFITPNNPDGKVLSRTQLEQIASLSIARDLWVFADEAYADHAFDLPHVSIATLPDMAERTITAHSLSKSHALAGVRLGCVVGPALLVKTARKVAIHTTFNVPVVAQRSALAALQAGDAWADRAKDEYRAARDVAIEALAGAPVKFGHAEGGTYLFLDFAEALRGRPLQVLLERAIDHGVLLAPGEAFGRAWSTHARLCYTAVPRPRLLEGIARLRKAIDSLER
jgi:aspartate/methionine/tyrosine aminotransferase